jgi:anti-sigma factor RsiW
MNCADCRAELVAYLDLETGPTERQQLEAHLAGCAACRAALEAERRLSGVLASLPALEPPADFEARFWARIAREQEAPLGWRARLFSRRLVLTLGGAAVLALAAIFSLRGRTDPDADWQIEATSEDYELLEDPDLELIEIVDVLEEWDGDQG